MLRVRMFDIAAILLLPPLICQLSNCSASINGGFSGKAAVKKVIAMLYKLDWLGYHGTDTEGCTTAGITIELGENNAVKVKAHNDIVIFTA